MQYKYNFLGTFKSKEIEEEFKESIFIKNKRYTFLIYFLCCLFFVLAGVFGDFQREFFYYGPSELLGIRLLLFAVSVSFIIFHWKSSTRPRYWEYWLDSMKLLSTLVIILLTVWTKGTSLTLLPGIMMMVGSFYIILPGRARVTNICAIALLMTFIFWQDPIATYGIKVHRYMIFMLAAIEILLLAFHIKLKKGSRLGFAAKKELDLINDTKDKLLATLAHDIRNPLAIIMARAERCRIQAERGDVEKVVEVQNSIIKSVVRLDGLLIDVLDWAVVEMQKGKTLKEIANISTSIKDAIEFVNEQAQVKDITFFTLIEPCEFSHETVMMKTCVRNTLSNAIKFSKWGSEVSIVGRQYENFYEIVIGDNGPGMDEKLISDVLTGDNLKTELGSQGEKGTGLGLKLVKNVIDRHNGKMFIDSKINNGTKFTFKIPIDVPSLKKIKSQIA
jgi:signal transduction histidine kinase